MNFKNRRIVFISLCIVAIAIKLLSLKSIWVEKYYSGTAYPLISNVLKALFGWLPFSIGDVIYGIAGLWLLIKTVRGVKKILKKQVDKDSLKNSLYKIAITLLSIYISFNILWGLNYNRKGITWQLSIKKEKYSIAELIQIDSLLITKVNESKTALIQQKRKYPATDETFDMVTKAYNQLSSQYPWLLYKTKSTKTSLWGWAGNYMGFTGYYNPFTGEAQLNTTVPQFIQPYTACHEVAHQLGYAKENEANFVGYLAATSSTDTLLHYSVYLDLYLYTQNNLRILDSSQSNHMSLKLTPEVRADIAELKTFYKNHQSPFEPLFKWIYEKYLQNNQQPSGLLSYDEVTGFIIAYYKKFGRI